MDTDNNGLTMMNGSGTTASYLQIGQRADIRLGIKLLGLEQQSPNKVYLAFRVRSARHANDSFEHPEQETNVVSLDDSKLTLASAWPLIKFEPEKINEQRASCIVGVYLRGDLYSDPIPVLQAVLDEGKIDSVVDFVMDACGEYRCLRPMAARAWARAQIQPAIDGLKKKAMLKAKQEELAESSIGTVDWQAAHLAKLHAALHPNDVAFSDTDAD